jgi:LysR family glycine cleavage system transcriptional activator
MRRLPPFDELVAFEAVARHLSFTRAAEELCITQSAVSHRIRRLEQHFAVSLVQRKKGDIALTEAGLAMLPGLVAALENLSQLGRPDGRRLRVAAASALCTWWLAGRLPQFMAQRPGVSVELVPIDSVQSPIPDVDVRVLWIASGQEDTRSRQAPLFVEAVFPVCSPSLLPDGRPLRDASQLLRLPLLHKASNSTGEWSWSVWLERLGVSASPQARSELSCADMGLVMSAAVSGAGVALTRSLLAHDALVSQRLVPALAEVAPMASVKHHVARWPASKAADADVLAFVEWLVEEARVTLASTARLMQFPLRALRQAPR